MRPCSTVLAAVSGPSRRRVWFCSNLLIVAAVLLTGCLRHGTCAEEPDNRFCRDAGRRDAARGDGGRDAAADSGMDGGADAAPDATVDAPADAGPCRGLCGPTEVCAGDAGCVDCVDDTHCMAPRPACDMATNACVECVDDLDCPGGRCRAGATAEENRCVECVENDDCTPTECRSDGLCSGESGSCEVCVNDRDCPVGYDCMPMEFEGTLRADAYCLPRRVDSCSAFQPLSVPADGLTSTDGRTGDYCTLNEAVTTCEAIERLGLACPCPVGSECRGGMCTIRCGSNANCNTMPPANACSDGLEPRFCE